MKSLYFLILLLSTFLFFGVIGRTDLQNLASEENANILISPIGYQTLLLADAGSVLLSYKTLMIVILAVIAIIFYYKLSTLKNRYRDLEEDIARQTEGLRSSNSMLLKKNEEIYKQVSRVIAQQDHILKQNFQLEYKAEALRRSNISKDHLIGTLITDLENPVVSLTEIAESLNEALPRLSKKEISVFLRTIHGCSYDVHATLSNLVKWDELQAKETRFHPTGFHISDVIKDNVVALSQDLTRRNLRIDFQVDDDHKILSDKSMISIVIRNLLVSAIKTSVQENIVIRSEENEKRISISIVHHVDDFTLEQYENLLRDTTPDFTEAAPKGSLSSLALTIAREFIRINNGEVKVTREGESQINCCVSLPRASQSAKKKVPVTEERRRQSSVLIADESAELRVYIKRILSPHFKILEATNGKDALAIAQKFIPNIIISEVLLPELDGFQLCQNIKNDKATSQIPFIFLTSEWEESKKNAGLQAGATVYLVKPVSKELLLQAVSEMALRKQETSFPEALPRSFKTSEADNFLERVMRIIEENLADPDLDHRRICEQMAMSKSVLYTKFRHVTGLGVQEFIKSIRLEKSLKLLIEGGMTINQIAIEVGFNSQSYFNKCFLKQFGIGPREYARKNKKTAHFRV